MPRHKPQEDYADRMRSQNCMKVSTWVPSHMREELLDIAEEMRRENAADLREERANKK